MISLINLKIGVLIGKGVNQIELVQPREALEKSSVIVETISLTEPEVKAWVNETWSIRIKVDKLINSVTVDDYNGLLLPGGKHTDEFLNNTTVQNLIKQYNASGKLIGATGTGICLLCNAGILEGRLATSPERLRDTLIEAGGVWNDNETVADNGIITCKTENNLDHFTTIFLDQLREGVHQRTETII